MIKNIGNKSSRLKILLATSAIVAILGAQLVPLFQPKTAALQYNFQDSITSWIDKANITVKRNGQVALFVDSNPNDAKREFIFKDGCGDNKITITSGDNVASITYSTAFATDFTKFIDPKPPTGTCGALQTYTTVEVKDTQNASKDPPDSGPPPIGDLAKTIYKDATFAWKNGGQIVSSKPNATFTAKSTEKTVFTSNTHTGDETKCYDQITDVSADFKTATIRVMQEKVASGGTLCADMGSMGIKLGSVANQKKAAVYADSPNQDQGGDAADSCYQGISVFGWVLCPMLDLADGIYGFLRSAIFSLLAVPELTSTSQEGLYASWGAVRNIANALLVIVALFMIISQIFDFGFVDAYTVKKVLPRLIIAAILIQLSWFLCSVLIQIFNAVGYGLNTLITAPFTQNGGGDIVDIIGRSDNGAQNAAGIFSTTGLVVGGISLGLATLAPGGILTVALVAVGVIISILLTIFTLVIRKLLIVALVLLAPVAFVAWILPNTQKFWNSWWNLFIKLLIMFPLIALLFAAGQIFAAITVSMEPDNSAQGGLNDIIAIIAYFAPLFLIPATYKFAGGIFATVAGAINNTGGKVKQNGFGLRARKDAYQKLKNEERATNTMIKARSDMSKALDPNANRFQRLRGRAALGAAGFGVGSNKRLIRAQSRYAASSDKQGMDEAGLEWNGLSKTASFPQLTSLENAVTSARIGQTVVAQVNDANGTAQMRRITVTQQLQRQALASAATNKNIEAMELFASGQAYDFGADGRVLDGSTGTAATTRTRGAEERAQTDATLSTFLNKDGGFGAVDSIASDISRGAAGDITNNKSFAAGLKNFGTQKGERQQQMVDHVNALASGSVTNTSAYGFDVDAQKQKAAAAAIINGFATRDDKKDMAGDIAKWGGITIQASGGGTMTAQDIIDSNGNIAVRVDPTTGNLIAVNSGTT